ncbi:MAG: OmpA family protein ['Candidatus Kapabacteria' thiocyanatum]|uniref:VWFA domain-containing protein n=1 Tax=Candidatus Kapaibacterium thiocyanatum TaxID=1895771 RepID=A0A1M3KVC0_9BACT|nr:OmpA family protein ['Candidatus Kapabacteria' thiocyanatum]OJX56330.1 MAG: hypothetical protein BGO89_13430 ['Candidatus Kapabacteria' thiocyanatum]
MRRRTHLLLLTLASCALMLDGCRSVHRIEGDFDLREDGERVTELRFTQTRHIDSVDIRKLMVDVWKIEHYAYPDSIRLFVRVLDSTGNVVTHMAQPYAKPGAPNYFPRLDEHLGSRRKRKDVNIAPYKVREFGEQDSIPTSISLALDYSGSMKGVKDAIDEGTQLFIGMKRNCDRIAVTGFSREVTTVFPLSSDTTMMLREFREYAKRAQGLYTSANDGIMKALNHLDAVPVEQPKVCVVFADGDENQSMVKLPDIFEYAVKHNISIYCVGFGYAQDEELQSLALYTGGKYYRAYTKKDLVSIFLDIYRSLRNYYLVTYVPPRYDGLHTVDVTVDVPGRDTLVARGQYDKTPLNPISPTDEFSRPILFAFRSSTIDSSSMYIVDEIADAMHRFERVIIEIQGHTDNVGTEDFNQKLSDARADAVRQALIEREIEPSRLRTRGFGFTVPVVPNDTEENRAKNRRTVFKILRK